MSDHLSGESIERYKQRRLSAAELLAADDHLAVCEFCLTRTETPEERNSFTSLRAGLRAEALEQPQHLPFDLLAAYVDDVADEVDREIATSHFEICAACADESKELRAFRAEIRAYSERDYEFATRPHLGQRLLAILRAPGYRIPLQVAGLATMALLIGWVATLSLRRQVADLRAQVIDLQRANDALVGSLDKPQPEQPANDNQRAFFEIAVALYDNESLVTLDKNGNLSGLQLSPEIRKRVQAALLSGNPSAPDIEELSRRRGTLLGPHDGVPFALVSPIGIVTQNDRPIFRWRPLAGGVTYIVQVFDSSFNKVVVSPPLTITEWAAAAPLERGRIYSWQVVARVDGKEIASPEPPAPEARFKVLDQSQLAELERIRRDYKSHLVLGTAYAQAGLLEEAEGEFRALFNANPTSPAAQRLLKRIQALRAAK